MASHEDPSTRAIPPALLIHQEGVIGVIALVGLSLREGGVALGLAAKGSLGSALGIGVGTGVACSIALLLLRRWSALANLERWQRRMVSGWTPLDAAAVAAFSGLAEEALIRALLQPVIGLVPAALLFAALHIVPDRRLWLWPILAFLLGVVLGKTYDYGGYPAAAATHIVINAFALMRLQRLAVE